MAAGCPVRVRDVLIGFVLASVLWSLLLETMLTRDLRDTRINYNHNPSNALNAANSGNAGNSGNAMHDIGALPTPPSKAPERESDNHASQEVGKEMEFQMGGGGGGGAADQHEVQTEEQHEVQTEEQLAVKIKKLRIFCFVPFIYDMEKKTQQYYNSIVNTWGKRCDILKFISEPLAEGIEKPDNVDELFTIKRRMGDSICGDKKPCHHIWEKVWRSWVYIEETYIDQADWFVKIDHDTYFFPENAKRLVADKGWSADDPHYCGQKVYHRQVPINAGGATLFSRGVIRLLAPHYKKMKTEDAFENGKCIDRKGATEELSTAICLKEIGITAEESLDRNGKDTILLFYPSAHLGMTRPPQKREEGWYWLGKPDYTKDGLECCSEHPIGFHNQKTPGAFENFEKAYYPPTDDDFYVENDITREYYYTIRKALKKSYAALERL